MMFVKSRIHIAVLALLCVVTLSGCVNKNTIVGSYNMGGDAAPGIMIFSPDGSVHWSQPLLGKSGEGTWELEDNYLTIRLGRYLWAAYKGDVEGSFLRFSVYGPINQYDTEGNYLYTEEGSVIFSRRPFGLFNALLQSGKNVKLKNEAGMDSILSNIK
jgi:hypothetical protein